ncbi:hypothetical protein HY485_02705 [Candidatus Woesearchaeota archaeon]|nr:hypothetical protein [Candidatus Woesearchaeota archaeon]
MMVKRAGVFEKNIDDGGVKFLLTNRHGAYVLFGHEPKSRYEGVFFRTNHRMIKLIESFVFSEHVTAITNRLGSVSLKRGELAQSFFMPLYRDALVLEMNAVAEFELVLDVKLVDDHRVWGRNYDVMKDGHALVISFSKKTDSRDDNSVFGDEFEVHLAVYAPDLEFLPLQHWEEHKYCDDEARHSQPFARWVFKPCKIRAKDVVFAWGLSRGAAVAEAKEVFDSRDRLRRERENHVHELISACPKIKNEGVSLAYQCAVNALDSLIVGDEFVEAGLPWFYQRWARDEIICTKAFLLQKNFVFAKKILLSYLPKITNEGLLPNIVDRDAPLLSSDAVGWLAFRCKELFDAAGKKRSSELVSSREKQQMADALQLSLSRVFEHRLNDGLIESKKNETWMDTEFGNDSRTGFPVEVQALTLALGGVVRRLTGKSDKRVAELFSSVRKNFFRNKVLFDTAGHVGIRPNVFIAAYVFPDLLSKNEWIDCFEIILPKLWLGWGGLSSIDKKHPLFTDVYTGEDNKSYHRGDSWFWLNNLAAIVLHRLAHKKFEKYIMAILEASASEILYKGATGFASEISSARELSSKGCVAQAWSNALFIELVRELVESKKL